MCTLNALVASLWSMKTLISSQKILFTKLVKLYLVSTGVIHLSELGNYPTLKLLYVSEQVSIAQSPVDCRYLDKLYLEFESFGMMTNFSNVKELYLLEVHENEIEVSNAWTNLQMLTISECNPSFNHSLGNLVALHLNWCFIDEINTNLSPAYEC
jgi:hypothetical protein